MRFGYKVSAVIAVLIIGLVMLFIFNPEKTIWVPKCPVYVLTGLKCPACGVQRATHSILHLNFAQAIKYNFFLVFALPYAVLLIIVTWLDPKSKLRRLKQLFYSNKTVYFYLFCMIAWWVVRNILDI